MNHQAHRRSQSNVNSHSYGSIYLTTVLIILLVKTCFPASDNDIPRAPYTLEQQNDGLRRNPFLPDTKDYPYVVYIDEYPVDLSRRKILCSGTIISPDKILTAAHCIYHRQPSNLRVYLKMPPEDNSKSYLVDRVVVHEEYFYERVSHDIGVLKLKQPINLEAEGLSTIKLSSEGKGLPLNTTVKVISFGSIGSPMFLTHAMEEDAVSIEDHHCTKSLTVTPEQYLKGLGRDQFCVHFVSAEDRICLGDAGEPLILKGNTSQEDVLFGIGSKIVGKMKLGSRWLCYTRRAIFTNPNYYQKLLAV